MIEIFKFWISFINKCINWCFNLVIDNTFNITLGEFLLSFAIIGLALLFVFSGLNINLVSFGRDLGKSVDSNNSNKGGNK